MPPTAKSPSDCLLVAWLNIAASISSKEPNLISSCLPEINPNLPSSIKFILNSFSIVSSAGTANKTTFPFKSSLALLLIKPSPTPNIDPN